MRLNKATGLMSKFLTHTWHVVEGCEHGCIYCWAEKFAQRRGRDMALRFNDTQLEGTLRRKGLIIGVSWTGDMWGESVPKAWIESVLDKIAGDPQNTYVPLTKNPGRYLEFAKDIPPNVILGATIESDIHYPTISEAPDPFERYQAMQELEFRKFIIVEPILKFNLDVLVDWIRAIQPVAVEIGADSGGNKLPEPSASKIQRLVKRLDFTKVLLKDNLSRLSNPRPKRLDHSLDVLFTKAVTKPLVKPVTKHVTKDVTKEVTEPVVESGTKPTYYLGGNEAFWMTPEELKALQQKYKVMLV